MTDDNQPYWKFKQYPLTGGKGAIDKWRGNLDNTAELEFQTVVNTLSAIRNKQSWNNGRDFKTMVGWKGIGELRFKNAAGKPMRVFGFFRDDEQEFVMLLGGTHDGKKYDPPDSKDIAIGRKKDIELGRDLPIDFDFSDGDDEEDEDEYLRALLGLE